MASDHATLQQLRSDCLKKGYTEMLEARLEVVEAAQAALQTLKITGSKDVDAYQPLLDDLTKAIASYDQFVAQKLKPTFAFRLHLNTGFSSWP